MLLHLAVLNLK